MAAFALRYPFRNVTAEMNITPLVDVMLVLLVIFMLAAPLPTRKLALLNPPPCQTNCPPPVEPVRLALKHTGELYWNGTAISRAALAANLAGVAQDPQKPAIEIHAEAHTRYDVVTDVLVAARNAGVDKIGIAPMRD